MKNDKKKIIYIIGMLIIMATVMLTKNVNSEAEIVQNTNEQYTLVQNTSEQWTNVVNVVDNSLVFAKDGYDFTYSSTIETGVDVEHNTVQGEVQKVPLMCINFGKKLIDTASETIEFVTSEPYSTSSNYQKIIENQDIAYFLAFLEENPSDTTNTYLARMQAGIWRLGFRGINDQGNEPGPVSNSEIQSQAEMEDGESVNLSGDSYFNELVEDAKKYKQFFDANSGGQDEVQFKAEDISVYPVEGQDETPETIKVMADQTDQTFVVGPFKIKYTEYAPGQVDAESTTYNGANNNKSTENKSVPKFSFMTKITVKNQDDQEMDVVDLLDSNGQSISGRPSYKYPYSEEEFYIKYKFDPNCETTEIYIGAEFEYLARCYAEYREWLAQGATVVRKTAVTEIKGKEIIVNGYKYIYYRQDEDYWAQKPYWKGEMATHGCGPAALAILISGYAKAKFGDAWENITGEALPQDPYDYWYDYNDDSGHVDAGVKYRYDPWYIGTITQTLTSWTDNGWNNGGLSGAIDEINEDFKANLSGGSEDLIPGYTRYGMDGDKWQDESTPEDQQIENIRKSLQAGIPVFALIRPVDGKYSGAGHYVVIMGFDENGDLIIGNPISYKSEKGEKGPNGEDPLEYFMDTYVGGYVIFDEGPGGETPSDDPSSLQPSETQLDESEIQPVLEVHPYVTQEAEDEIVTETDGWSTRGKEAAGYSIWKTAKLEDSAKLINVRMELGGIAFIDVPSGKDTDFLNVNGLYDEGHDILLPDTEVTLYEADGTLAEIQDGLTDDNGRIITNPTITDSNGEYIFKGLCGQKRYYVTFTLGAYYNHNGKDYLINGQSFESTKYASQVNSDKKKNKATIFDDDRQEFNSRFEEITETRSANKNYAVSGNANLTYNIYDQTYDTAQQEKEDIMELQKQATDKMREYILNGSYYSAKNPGGKKRADIYNEVANSSGIADASSKMQYLEDIVVIATSGNHGPNPGLIPEHDRYIVKLSESQRNNVVLGPYTFYANDTEVNFGALAREKFDFKIAKDIKEIKVTINGKEHIYKCNARQNEAVDVDIRGSDIVFDSNVDRTGAKKTSTYERDLRESDIKFIDYVGEGSDRKLRVYVTYKIKITNQSNGDITGYVTGLDDYYDEDYELISSTVDGQPLTWNNEGTVALNNEKNLKKVSTTGLSSIGINVSQYSEIITQYELKTNAIKELLEGDNETTDENFAEITSYRTEYTKNRSFGGDQITAAGDAAGLVDRDSRPGDFDFTKPIKISNPISKNFANANDFVDYTYTDEFINRSGEDRTKISLHAFQDDTDKAPGLKLRLLQQLRIITGNVFEDSILKDKLEQQNIRQGNGKYENGEDLINKLKVELIDVANLTGNQEGSTYRTNGNKGTMAASNAEIKDNVTDVYVKASGAGPGTGSFVPAVVKTGTGLKPNNNSNYNGKYDIETRGGYATGNYATIDKAGSYVISGYVPGDYLLRFVYGEKELLTAWMSDKEADKNRGKVYNGQDYKSTKFDEGHYTNTQSGYWYHDTRADTNSDAVDNLKRRNIINNHYIDEKMNIKTVEELDYVKSHYNGYSDDEKEQKIQKLEENTRLWADTPVMKMEVEYTDIEADYSRGQFVTYETYIVEGVDFGLVERPRQEITITKDIDNFRLIGNDGTPVFDAYDETINLAWIKPIKDMKNRYTVDHDRNGAIEAIIDENLMHGATVKLLYKLSIENTGEKDYYKDSGGEILVDEDFYIKGEESSSAKPVTNQATKIVDYVENNLKFNTNDASKPDDSFDVIDKTQTYNKDWERIKGEDNKGKKDDNIGIDSIKDYVLTSVFDRANNYNTIIQVKDGTDLRRALNPSAVRTTHNSTVAYGDVAHTNLYLTKIIDTSNDVNDNFLYNNSLEILETSNLAGRRCYNNKDKEKYRSEDQIIQYQIVSSVPGDYDPTEAGDPYRLQTTVASQPDYDFAERVTVTVPYGSTKTATIIIVSILVAVIILAVGIVLIKKIVLSPNKPPKIGT